MTISLDYYNLKLVQITLTDEMLESAAWLQFSDEDEDGIHDQMDVLFVYGDWTNQMGAYLLETLGEHGLEWTNVGLRLYDNQDHQVGDTVWALVDNK